MSSRILVVGKGLLGTAIVKAPWAKDYDVSFASRSTKVALDISDQQSVKHYFLNQERFDVIINCAADSNVDHCESNPHDARAVNALGVASLAKIAEANNSALIHISTDYVFEGALNSVYTESDYTGPRSIYGMTKLEGEYHALNSCGCSVVIRPTWIFGGERMDFVNAATRDLKEGSEIRVVNDQFANPTYSHDLAEAIEPIISIKLLPALKANEKYNCIYHITNKGMTTRFEMAQFIHKALNSKGCVLPQQSKDIASWQAVRPTSTSLSNKKYMEQFNYKMRPWQDALKEYVNSCKF